MSTVENVAFYSNSLINDVLSFVFLRRILMTFVTYVAFL